MQNFNTITGVLKLRLQGIPYTIIRQRFHIGDSTIRLITKRYEELGIEFKEIANGNPAEVEELFYPSDSTKRKDCEEPDWELCYQRIHADKSKVNLSFLWYEYKVENPDGYQQTQFYERYNKYVAKNYGIEKVSMAVERVPGERMYIDWVGDQPAILMDPETGELKPVHILVTTIGFSSYAYAEIFEDETLPNFLQGVSNALHFYGAVPRYMVPDNLRTAVTSHKHEELVLNAAFQDLEEFYDTIVIPPPPRKPKGKPTVENQVRTYETHLVEALKEQVFTSLNDIKVATRKIIADINNRKKSGFKQNRKELFEEYDRPNMKPLSPGIFTVCDYKYFSKVPDNYHLSYDDHYYSVSYKTHEKPAILKATFDAIIITDENNIVLATHKRSYSKFPLYITIDEHMPPHHLYYKEVNTKDGNYYRHWAESIGPCTYEFIDRLLSKQRHEETAYNSCNGILHMNGGKGKELFEAASARCLKMHSIGYKYFQTAFHYIKEHGIMPDVEDQEKDSAIPQHSNIRGKDEYK